MHIFRTNKELDKYLEKQIKAKKTIGFIPTLGALHDGHMSLIKASRSRDDIVVCSIFVNPTQFNQADDLKKYPRTIEADIQLLIPQGIDVLYYPRVEEVYPEGLDTSVELDLGQLAKVLEGEHRPGHFEGVMEVVKRLLDIVEPHRLYMGQKDYQQFSIIQYMLEQLKMPTELIVCPIIRESHGLAMSSRNVRLSSESRAKAKVIFETLSNCKSNYAFAKIKALESTAIQKFESLGFKPEYFKIVDGVTLTAPDVQSNSIVVCTAVWVDGVRLIDNVIIH